MWGGGEQGSKDAKQNKPPKTSLRSLCFGVAGSPSSLYSGNCSDLHTPSHYPLVRGDREARTRAHLGRPALASGLSATDPAYYSQTSKQRMPREFLTEKDRKCMSIVREVRAGEEAGAEAPGVAETTARGRALPPGGREEVSSRRPPPPLFAGAEAPSAVGAGGVLGSCMAQGERGAGPQPAGSAACPPRAPPPRTARGRSCSRAVATRWRLRAEKALGRSRAAPAARPPPPRKQCGASGRSAALGRTPDTGARAAERASESAAGQAGAGRPLREPWARRGAGPEIGAAQRLEGPGRGPGATSSRHLHQHRYRHQHRGRGPGDEGSRRGEPFCAPPRRPAQRVNPSRQTRGRRSGGAPPPGPQNVKRGGRRRRDRPAGRPRRPPAAAPLPFPARRGRARRPEQRGHRAQRLLLSRSRLRSTAGSRPGRGRNRASRPDKFEQ
jgi:hypothetical protein